jgi:hypothetical protein
MDYLGIPLWIWINAGFLIAFALVVWFKLATWKEAGASKQSEAPPKTIGALGKSSLT